MWRDDAYLLDMLLTARRALQHVDGMDEAAFLKDALRQDAVLRCLGIVGEAAGRVSAEFQAEHANIAWREMVALRNRLIHEYLQVNLTVVWRTVRDDLPRLIADLEPLAPPE